MCPFLEQDDPRCADHLNLYNLVQAMEHCACHYRRCPLYRQVAKDAYAAQKSQEQLAVTSW